MVDHNQGVMPNEPEAVTSRGRDSVGTPEDELQGVEYRDPKAGQRLDRMGDRMASGDETTPDRNANLEQAKVVGDEAIGGTAPTPEQNLTESNAAAAGVEIPDRQPLAVEDMLDRRDDQRWELDPQSSDDYQEHDV
ncbi:hypothetical protein IQ268_17750 [Oculatella sp. LEGE 06141]|nr:hypothetical protein [Oculatella sp. LEGE 06141]